MLPVFEVKKEISAYDLLPRNPPLKRLVVVIVIVITSRSFLDNQLSKMRSLRYPQPRAHLRRQALKC
jgi:hypothetical protein